MPFTLFRFLLLLALLLLGRSAVHAQSAPASEPTARTASPAVAAAERDSRYASAEEVSELKTQLNSLLQAYDQLVTRYNTQSSRLQELERARAAAPAAATDRHRALRASAMPGSY